MCNYASYYPLKHQLEVSRISTGGRAYIYRKSNDLAWQVPTSTSLANFAPPNCNCSMVYYHINNQLEVFTVGNDGRVYVMWKQNNLDWEPVPGQIPVPTEGISQNSRLDAVCYPLNDQLELFAHGNDGRFYVMWKDNNLPWHDPVLIGA